MKEKPLTEFLKSEKMMRKESKKEEVERALKLKGVEGPWELPEGWRWVRLRDVLIEDKTPINPQEFPEKDFWLVTMDNVESHTGRLIKRVIVKGREIQSTKYVFNEEHILYGKLRPYLNKVYEPDGRGICTTEFVPFRVKDCADKRFVAIYLRSPWVVSYANSLTKGARQPRVRIKDLLDFPIPLPPLPEQKRIVAKLNEIQTKLEEAKRLAREAKEQAEKLMASVLHEVFSKADKRGWEWVRLGDIAKLTSGGTPSRKVKEYWESGTIPWVKSGELEDNVIYSTEEKITELGLKKSSAKVFPKGTLLIALYGATVGKTAILGIDAATNQAICAVFPKNSKEKLWDEKFLQYYIINVRPQLIAESGGGAQPNIYIYTLKRLKVPLPSLEEQKCIVAYLDRINEKAQQLVKLYEKRERELERLFPAVLDRAFRGEL